MMHLLQLRCVCNAGLSKLLQLMRGARLVVHLCVQHGHIRAAQLAYY
jgi:hypothetical protein